MILDTRRRAPMCTDKFTARMCENGVCPPMAPALIQANFVHEREIGWVAA